jgi:hypothetical protein
MLRPWPKNAWVTVEICLPPGVALLDALLARGILTGTADQLPGAAPQARSTAAGFEVSAEGESALRSFGVDVLSLRRARRRFAGPCLDWTQRRPHLNGALGAAITTRLLDLG